MSISTEIQRISNAKENIINAITEKGVEVNNNAKIDVLADYISNIKSGGEFILEDLNAGANANNMLTNYIKKMPPLDLNGIKSAYMLFSNFKLIEEVNLLNTESLTNISSMFYNCNSLKKLPNINYKNVEKAESFLSGCNNLVEVVLDFPKVTNCSSICMRCANLKRIVLTSTNNLENFRSMCSECVNLVEVNEIIADKVNHVGNAPFENCTNLTTFGGFKNLGKNYTTKRANEAFYSIFFDTNNKFTHASLINIVNKIYDLNLTYNVTNGGTLYTQRLVLGNTNKAKLTAEEIAIRNFQRMDNKLKGVFIMQYVGHTKPILLIAEKGKKIKLKNDIYKEKNETEAEHIPYYTDVIFLADGITEEQAREMYVEE